MIPLITDLFEVPFSLHHSALVQVSGKLTASSTTYQLFPNLCLQDLFTNSELQKLSQRLFEAFSKPGEVALD